MTKRIAIVWKAAPVTGAIEASDGKLAELSVSPGGGAVEGNRFSIASHPCRLEVTADAARLGPGGNPTMLTVRTDANSFSLFLRDVSSAHPILIPSHGIAVTEADDPRSYAEIEEAIRARGLATELALIQAAPEESYGAAEATRSQRCQTWLGLSRDMRIFRVDVNWREGRWGWIQPAFHAVEVKLPETEERGVSYDFVLGRGAGCAVDISRRLEDGALPILRSDAGDGDVIYHVTTFATLERSPLRADTLRGTHFLVADGNAVGHMFTPAQQQEFESMLPAEMNRDEEVVLWLRAEAENTGPAPAYAWFKVPRPNGARALWSFDANRGFGSFSSGRVFCISRLDGEPPPQEEFAVLVAPGRRVVFEFCIPHSPISVERAQALAGADFDQRHAECRDFWHAKLAGGGQLRVPEPRVDEMAHAGLLHLDLVTYGLEPQGTLAPTIGLYSPIGTESAPIILFYDSLGWHDVARRAATYFLDKQHDDGFIQNFGDYMVETGAALFVIGEHYRYTRDDEWVRRIAPKLLKSCDYLLAWRRRNQTEELRGRGYGMLDGKVGDPEDATHYFMNSGYAYAGIKRVAEMLRGLDAARSRELEQEAQAFREDIRAALLEAVARAPVVPLRDGTWCPSAPPWAEHRGPVSLFAEGKPCLTHGSFATRDSLVGPLWLVFTEVLEADEPVTDALVNFHQQLFTMRNVAFSQPYYSRHDFAHLRRGEVKAFLRTYYNAFAGLADRETYTFWEHYHGASPHKTHEEAWFLMQTRWMLWLEDGETLKLLAGIPRAWLEDGQRIELRNVGSYFGPLSLQVESRTAQGVIIAVVECRSDHQPRTVEIRLPHPAGRRATRVTGGAYDAERETVVIEDFRDAAEVRLEF